MSQAGDDRGADSNGTESVVSLAQGEEDKTVDYGLVGTGVIGDQLFVDVNRMVGLRLMLVIVRWLT